MVNIDCPACGVRIPRERDSVKVEDPWYGTPGSFTFVTCQNPPCRTLVQVPAPTNSVLAQAYADYYTHSIEESSFKRVLQALFGGRLRSLNLPESRGRVLLDFGCGDGQDMVALRERGWDVLGIDTDAGALNAARRRGLPVYASLADLPPASEIDVVLLRHVVEHIRDPAAFLRSLLPHLSDEASLVIVTPNCNSAGRRILKKYWRGYDAPRHLQVFSPGGLALLIHRSGYRVIQLRTGESSPGGMHSESLAHLIGRLGVPSSLNYVLGRLGGLLMSLILRAVPWPSTGTPAGEEMFVLAGRGRIEGEEALPPQAPTVTRDR